MIDLWGAMIKIFTLCKKSYIYTRVVRRVTASVSAQIKNLAVSDLIWDKLSLMGCLSLISALF